MKKLVLLIGLLTYSSVGWTKTIVMKCPPSNMFLKHDFKSNSMDKRENGKWVPICLVGGPYQGESGGMKMTINFTVGLWKEGGRCDDVMTFRDGSIQRTTMYYDFLYPTKTSETTKTDVNKITTIISKNIFECELVD